MTEAVSLSQEISDIINLDVPNRHTFFQLNFFVIGREPTHQAKLHRCVEELKARKQQVDSMFLEIDDLRDRNELIYLEMGKAGTPKENEIRTRMSERRIEQNNKSIDTLNNKLKNTEEEIVFFVRAFHRLSEIEPMKEWDNANVQTEYWNAKIAEEVSYRILMQLPLDIEIIRTALALPNEAPVKKQVNALLEKRGKDLIGINKV